MTLKASNIFLLTIGSLIGVLAILTTEYAAVITGYFVLVLAALIAFAVAIHEGRPLYTVREGVKFFVGLGLLVWLLAVVAAAALAAF
ncbi:hypothetical protein IB265_34705 [Ensifer sp. ENS10]|uniref:hypothetical protein n=1 Tax=Ensifer sp. ENS10 TaxID=2769286 RepID=UPI00177ED941|nr:hypothetical protein [Ensifer sp. ENS10]MBD9511902.1 hypothetical protein [Ensifer sp. ENS10]